MSLSLPRVSWVLGGCILLACLAEARGWAAEKLKDRTALLPPGAVNLNRLSTLRDQGFTAIGLMLTDATADRAPEAAQLIHREKLSLDYWIEIGRNPALADSHPEWMASIQTHPEWRRFFPQFPKPGSNEVVKAYPWVPALYRETFDVHVRRVSALLRGMPVPRRVFLNDLQGPPSACGCGHPLCRWTTDYGPLTSASRLTNGAAAGFVAAVKHLAPGVEVIPVWATECEEHDKDGLCAGVGCFRGTCWREWTAQLTPLAAEAHTVAALLLSGEFQRDLPGNDPRAVWIARALAYFQEMPARYKADGIPRNRLIAVLQGWNVTEDQLNAQMALADESGAMGVVVAYGRIEQSWEPRMHRLSGNRAGARGNEGPADSPSKK